MRLLHGPFGERFEIVPRTDPLAREITDEEHALAVRALPTDLTLVEAWLHRALEVSWNEHVLRRLVDDGAGLGSLESPALAFAIAVRLVNGELRLRLLARDEGWAGGLAGEREESDADEPPPRDDEIRPCDFETVAIACSHERSGDFRFWRDAAGLDHHNLAPPPGGGIASKILEVVADHTDKGADEISVKLEGGPGYTCSSRHPKITVSSQVGADQVFEGETSAKFKAKSRPLLGIGMASRSPFSVIAFFFFRDAEVNRYTIDVQACGVRSGGEIGFGRSQIVLKAYPSDVYQLAVSIPSLKKAKLERSATAYRDKLVFEAKDETTKGLAGEKETDKRQVTVSGSGVKTKDEYSFATRDGKLTETTTTDHGWGFKQPESETELKESKDGVDGLAKEIGASLTLKRNGKDVEEAAYLGKMVKAIFEIEKEVKSIQDFIKKFQPSVGFKFSLELEVFKGDLKLDWGYKEWKDHTVYRWWKFSIEMTLIKIALELKFGIEFRIWKFGIDLCVYGKITLDAKVSGSKESTPDDSKPWEVTVKSEPKGELGIKAALGPDALSIGGKVEAGYSFTAKCKVTTQEPFRVDWSMDRKETVAKIEGKIKWIGSFERKVLLIEEKKNVKKGYFPN
ncbi:MAG: hypothetical protein KF729_28275 [Sandaracinaceae bacterium]|nr:hypothetical protein [Sandaracinaceae bacterium]